MKKILALVLVAVSVLGLAVAADGMPEFVDYPEEYVAKKYPPKEGEPEWLYVVGLSMEKTSGRKEAMTFAKEDARLQLVRQIFDEISGYTRDTEEMVQMGLSEADSSSEQTDNENTPFAMETLQRYWEASFSVKSFPSWQSLEHPVWLDEKGNGRKYWMCAALIRAPKSEVSKALQSVDVTGVMDKALDMMERKEKISVSRSTRERMEKFAEEAKDSLVKKVEENSVIGGLD